ncbi:hypothetical protein FJY84_07740 [Candidatus Bathyarchaeota archaeon]|nr:hypothetical protein [Candidatus Bathyarchaeota archaeon]
MEENIQSLIENSVTFNNKTITVNRSLILFLLSYFKDGLQYRELKNSLNISDGKLASNLNYLHDFGYLKKEEVEIDNKKLDVYFLTELGRREVEKIFEWMELAIRLVKNGDR